MEVMRAIPIDSAPSSRSRRDIRDISASITSITSARDLTDLVIRDMLEGSVFFAADKEPTCLPSFQPNEVEVGALLGHGEFGEVLQIERFTADTQCSCLSCQSAGLSVHPTRQIRAGILPKHPKSRRSPQRRPTSVTVESCIDSGNNQSRPITKYVQGDTNKMASLTGHETDETEQGDNLSDDMEDDHLFSSDDESVNYPSEEAERKAWMVHHPSRNGDARYVVKRLSSKVSPDMHDDAIVDLTCEAMFLTQMSHPNIARLRATVGSPGTASFMLVLDRLTENLHVKISHWKRDVQHCRGKLGFFRRDKVGLEALFTERLLAAFDIARALRHLHRHKIIYRDIKPENIGVDMQGDMRLFDFGLAKEVKIRALVESPDSYNLTGLCGSRRYMAPEVVKSVPYGFKADVFSLSILLWELFALARPFCKFDAARHYDLVVAGKQRPKLNAQWPAALRSLMQDGWADQAVDRPDIFQVCQRLEAQILPLKGSKDYHLSTRSTYLTEHSRHSSVGLFGMEE